MKIRCSKCGIELRKREMSVCMGLYEDYGVQVQMCSDCIAP